MIWKSYAYTSTYIPNWIGSILWYASNLPLGLFPAESQTLLTSTTEGSELDLFNPRLVPEKSSVSRSIRSLRLSRRTSTDLLDHSTGRRISPLILLTILFGSLSTPSARSYGKCREKLLENTLSLIIIICEISGFLRDTTVFFYFLDFYTPSF